MSELELCHWLIKEPTGIYRIVFAPMGDAFENYVRVGAAASSRQLVFPMAFAVHKDEIIPAAEESGVTQTTFLRFSFYRDENDCREPAFSGMDPLKMATLVSELSNCIAHWTEAVGSRFISITLCDGGDFELALKPSESDRPHFPERTVVLTKSGIEMMAFARGLKCAKWAVDPTELGQR